MKRSLWCRSERSVFTSEFITVGFISLLLISERKEVSTSSAS